MVKTKAAPVACPKCKAATQKKDWPYLPSTPDTIKPGERLVGTLDIQNPAVRHDEQIPDDQEFQERVLSLFHATTVTFDATNCMKLIENHLGKGSYVMGR